MIRTALVLLATLGLTACASGLDKVDGLSVEIIEYGLFSGTGSEDAFVSNAGLQESDTLPFITGNRYGLVFKVNGSPEGAQTNIKLQWAVTPGSVTNKRKLARREQPKIRTVTVGEYGSMGRTLGEQSYRRPFRDLFFITDMNGKVLARKEFTIIDAPSEDTN